MKRKVCWDCDEFSPLRRRALIVKFGAPGDALRTTPVLSRLRAEGYDDITWICDKASREVLSLARNIDRLVVFGPEAMALAMTEDFDTVFSLDKAPEALAIAMLARSDDKRGFARMKSGRLTVFDENSNYALRLGIDDDLKFRENRKTVPEIIFEMAGFDYAGEEYELEIPSLSSAPVNAPRGRVIALNIGVGPRWPSKAWPDDCWIELAGLLRRTEFRPVFVGGESERDLLENYAGRAGAQSLPPASLGIFAETLATSAGVVTCDSLAMHVALAVKTPTIGLFCSTTPAEIEWFGRGEAIRSGKGPCYQGACSRWPGCMRDIRPEAVMERLMQRVGTPAR
ncbi:MAG: glycosyltransferase family 9 protein [Candidatus Hydrogenedentota bacterium]